MALETLIKSALGTDLVEYHHEITEAVGFIDVKDETEINRILHARHYVNIFPGIIRVEAVEVPFEGTTAKS